MSHWKHMNKMVPLLISALIIGGAAIAYCGVTLNKPRYIYVGRYSFSTNFFIGSQLAKKKWEIKLISDKIRAAFPLIQARLRDKRANLKTVEYAAAESAYLLYQFTTMLLFEGKSVNIDDASKLSSDNLMVLFMRLQIDSSKASNGELLSALLELQKKARQAQEDAQQRAQEDQQAADNSNPADDLAEAVENLLEEAGAAVNGVTAWLGL